MVTEYYLSEIISFILKEIDIALLEKRRSIKLKDVTLSDMEKDSLNLRGFVIDKKDNEIIISF